MLGKKISKEDFKGQAFLKTWYARQRNKLQATRTRKSGAIMTKLAKT
jgi:hypothetical protein